MKRLLFNNIHSRGSFTRTFNNTLLENKSSLLNSTTRFLSASSLEQKTNSETATTKPRGRLFFITLEKSPIHQTEDMKESVRALKLKKVNQIQVHKDTPQIRGLIYKCRLLLSVKSVSTADLFPEGTEHLPQHVRLTMKEKNELKIRAMREKKSMHTLIAEFTAAKSASSEQ